MTTHGAGRALSAVLVLLGPGAASAGDQAARAPAPGGARLVLTGVWVQPGCAPTAVRPEPGNGSAQVECTGVAAYAGQLTGYAQQRISGRATASSATVRIVADIHARTHSGLCGTLRLEPERAVVTGTGATGVGPITSGTRDFVGVTGWYDATGVGVGGVAQGGYRITLRFPTRALPSPAATPCLPPAPGVRPPGRA